MKEIYMLNNGDSIDKVKYEYKIQNSLVKENKEFSFRYVELKEGLDDIILVKNYLPPIEYKISEGETLMDVFARGFRSDCNNAKENDTIIINKPRSIRYVAKPLEKLDDIAKTFGLTVDYIIKANNLKSDKLFVGQILWI